MSRKTNADFQSAPQRTAIAAAISAALAASTIAAPAGAQVLEEIIVSATKRSESVQEVRE